MLPKAELHVHLEGTATPDLIRRLARRNGLEPPDGLFATPERFAWEGFLGFLAAYDRAASVIRTAEDYRDVTYEYLAGCAADGVVYVELTASRDHARLVGLTDAEHWEGIARGIDDAREQHGIEARILSSAVRNFGVEQALDVAREAASRPHPYVVGFSLAGDEAGFPPAQFAEAYAIAAAAGLGCTVHAGEWAGAQSVRAALELPVTRISHGVRAIEDPAVVSRARAPRRRARGVPHAATSCSACSGASRSTPSASCGRPACRSRWAPTTRPTSAPARPASTRSPGATSALTTTSCGRSRAPRSRRPSPRPTSRRRCASE